MNNIQLVAILELLIPQVIQLIIDQLNMSNQEATERFYQSQVYSILEVEESKLWHFSAITIFKLFEDEFRTGHVEYPEEG